MIFFSCYIFILRISYFVFSLPLVSEMCQDQRPLYDNLELRATSLTSASHPKRRASLNTRLRLSNNICLGTKGREPKFITSSGAQWSMTDSVWGSIVRPWTGRREDVGPFTAYTSFPETNTFTWIFSMNDFYLSKNNQSFPYILGGCTHTLIGYLKKK